ncbi:MAG: hypothetical protein JRH20_11960 [Deltaproteobacteria bacterium]|nr:hypothetical protein [Deltaproteobacteria bacterium]
MPLRSPTRLLPLLSLLIVTLSACGDVHPIVSVDQVDAGDGECTPDCTHRDCGADDGCGGLCQGVCGAELVHRWSKSFGGGSSDFGVRVVVDSGGNTIIIGQFLYTADFGGGPLTSAGGYDVFIASYDPVGAHRWSRALSGPEWIFPIDLALDGADNLTVTGSFQGDADFGGGTLTSVGGFDIFIASYEAGGAHRWSKRFGSSLEDGGGGLSLDAAGNIIVTGHFGEAVDFGGGPLTSAGQRDIFVSMLDEQGNHRWSRRFGGPSDDFAAAVATDGQSHALVTGTFQGSAEFGDTMLVSAGKSDVFLASFTLTGVLQWSKGFGTATTEFASGVVVDTTGNVTIAGSFDGSIDFGGGLLLNAGTSDVFVASFDLEGEHRWSRRYGAALGDTAADIVVDDSGNVILTGGFNETLVLGLEPLVSAGNSDVFVVSHSPSGALRWSRRFGGTQYDMGSGVAVHGGDVVVTGSFKEHSNFGGETLTSVGHDDVFLVRLGPKL